MLGLFRKAYKKSKGVSSIGKKSDSGTAYQPSSEKLLEKRGQIKVSKCEEFAVHISKYIGQTVTVFVASGGISGLGFTGVLISTNSTFIRIITKIGPPPASSLGNTCVFPYTHLGFCGFCLNAYKYHPYQGFPLINTLGSVAYIPINKVIAFVHNTI